MKKILINSLFISQILVSCSLAPKYKRPPLPIADKLENQAEDKAENQSISIIEAIKPTTKISQSVKWQDFFKSENIKQIIQISLENNRDLKVAVLNIEAARALNRISQADFWPEIKAKSSLNREKTSGNINSKAVTEGISSKYNVGLASAFEIDLFGKIRSQNQASLENFLAITEIKNVTQVALIAEVANGYLQFLADQRIAQLSKQNVVAKEKLLKLATKKFELGLASKTDQLEAVAKLDQAKIEQSSYQKKLQQDKNALILLMGVTNSALFDDEVDLAEVCLIEALPENLSSEILLNRPDIMAAEHQLKSANASIGAARAAFFPSISLTGSFGYSSSDLNNLFSGSSLVWNFIPTVNLPIFEGGRNFANLKYSKTNKEIAVAKYEKAIQNSFREMLDQLADYKNLQNQTFNQESLTQAKISSYQIVNSLYEAGIKSLPEVLEAESQMILANQANVELKKEKLSNLVQIYKTMGGGL